MFPVLFAPIEYAVPAAEVKVPAPHAIVSASVTVKADVCVHPWAARFVLESPTRPESTEVAIEPPVIVMLDAATTPAFVTLKGAEAAVALPTQSRYVASAAEAITTSFVVPSVKTPVDPRTASPPTSVVELSVKPPTVPPVAVIFVTVNAPAAVQIIGAVALLVVVAPTHPAPVVST